MLTSYYQKLEPFYYLDSEEEEDVNSVAYVSYKTDLSGSRYEGEKSEIDGKCIRRGFCFANSATETTICEGKHL